MKTAKCEHCGASFVKNTSRHRFCKEGCGEAHRRGWRPRSDAYCKHCGDKVVMRDEHTGRGGAKRKFCCDMCRYDHVRGRPVRPAEERKAAQEAYLNGERERTAKNTPRLRKEIMPAISKEVIGWADIKAEMLAVRDSNPSRPTYGYRGGDKAIVN